ncbi:MAG: hypothetical protein MUO21_02330, partial [Nitrososphaeraceae archaeon]|nr:hypothetical protein [Nitrososphaeraceae archaeon]
PDWNKYLFNSTCQGNKEAILYCLSKGANNITECCFAVKLYGYIELLELFIDKKCIREAFINGNYSKFYSAM